MRALAGLGITFRVGKPNIKTSASHRLPNPDAVKVFLEYILDYVDRKKAGNPVALKRRNQGLAKSTKPQRF
jgi:hypothetical protein